LLFPKRCLGPGRLLPNRESLCKGPLLNTL
jgi:hypothetical protein